MGWLTNFCMRRRMTEETSDLNNRLAESKGKHDEQLDDLAAQTTRLSEELTDTQVRLERAFGERTTELADALDEQRRVTQVHRCSQKLPRN